MEPILEKRQKGRNHPGISVWPVRNVWSADLVFEEKMAAIPFQASHVC